MSVLDASALLALLFREPGSARVTEHLQGARMSTVNLTEVLSRFVRDGVPTDDALKLIAATPVEWTSFDHDQAYLAATLVTRTRAAGLSLADRACLALALATDDVAVTTDRVWADLDLGIRIEVVR
jgi:PIN domain nuclease of toxin-antitoxin system